MDRQLVFNDLRVRDNGTGDSRTIEGHAIMFGTPSEVLWASADEEAREVIAPSAVTRELLDSSDIKMTLYHERERILARSQRGKGSLKYEIDDVGVAFSFDAPHTPDGDTALEAVRRGDIAGCSFAFATAYDDPDCVERSREERDGKTYTTYTVKRINDIFDFALALDPAYPATDVSAREAFEPKPLSEGPGPTPQEVSRETINTINRILNEYKI